MKKSISLLLTGFLLLVALASCMDTETTDNSIFTDCAITQFSIEDVETTITTKDIFGEDSTYSFKVTGSNYNFIIDHLKREISNPDSLPKGIDVSKVMVKVTADGNVIVKKDDYDPSDKQNVEWGSVKDTINFSKPVTFRVVAYNGVDFRDYLVKLNVHQSDSTETIWKKVETAYPGKELKAPRAITYNGKVAVYGVKDNQLQVTVSDMGKNNWTALEPAKGLTSKAQYTEITCFNGKLYVADDQMLMSSADGVEWQAESANSAIDHLLGCNSKQLYAVTDKQFMASADALNWDKEETEYPAFIPDCNIYSVYQATQTNSRIERTVMMGQLSESNDSIAPVWYRQGNEPWTYMHTSTNKKFFLPNLKNLVVLYYKEYLIALGGEPQHTKYAGKPLSGIYVSLDKGLTWKQQKDENKYIFPTLSNDLIGNKHPFAAYVDDAYNIWLLFSETGEVWRGKLNFVAFEH